MCRTGPIGRDLCPPLHRPPLLPTGAPVQISDDEAAEGTISTASRNRLAHGRLAGGLGLALALLLPTLAQATPAFASDDPSLASAQLSGQVVQVESEVQPGHDGDPQTLLRLPDGRLTPVNGIEDVPSGATIDLTVDIPRTLEDDVQGDAGLAALDDARDEPAEPTSDVAQASTEAAAAGDVPLQATSIERVTLASAAANPAAQALTIAAVGVAGYPAGAYSDSVVSAMVSATSAYWSGQSDGGITFTQSEAVTRYTSSISCSNASALWNEGASRTGFTPGANKHLVLLLPAAAYASGGCGYGLGTIGSSVSSGGQLYVADNSWPALAHELGHNMSLWHANKLTCGNSSYDSAFDTSGDPTAPGCSVTEYGDGMDVMGTSAQSDTGGLSSIGLARLGLMPSAQARSVTAAGATTVTVMPLSGGPSASGIRSVTVTDPRNGNVYYLEDRQFSGQDTYGWQGIGNHLYGGSTTGYGLRVLRRGENGASVLLDPTPSSSSFDPDAVVRPGTTFLSASGGVSISAVPNSGGSITASIDLAAAGQSHGSTSTSTNDPTATEPTTTTVTAPARMLVGHTYTISGTVSGTDTPNGAVSLQIGDDEQAVPLSSGAFSASYLPSAAGDLDITANYAGASGFDESSDTTTATVLTSKSDADIAASAPAVSATARTARIDVQVGADDQPVSGTVRVLDDAAEDVGGGSLNSAGRVRISIPVPAPGKHSYSVVYGGADTVNAGSDHVSLAVAKYASKVRAALARTTISRRQATSVTVAVSSAGDGVATGKVALVGSRGALSSAKLNGGRARLTVPQGMPVGQQSLKVVYSGNSATASSSSAALVLRVVR